jgi:hypothetical protein
MLPPDSSKEALRKLFRRRPVHQLSDLAKVLKTGSRMSVFRRLKVVGYLSSFTHGGRYYTLKELTQFDQWGLWFYRDVGFSRAGTLKATVVELVERSSSGLTPKELVGLLKLPVPGSLYNALRELVGAGHVSRKTEAGLRLYLCAKVDRGQAQLAERQRQLGHLKPPPAQVATELIIVILVEALRAADTTVAVSVVFDRLVARAIDVTTEQVEQVFVRYGLGPEKKTAAPGSKPSRRSGH